MLALLFVAAISDIAWQMPAAPNATHSQREFEAVALSWSAPADGDVVVRVRASADGLKWSDWVGLTIDEDLTDRTEGRYFTSIAHFGESMRYLQSSRSNVTITFFAPPRITRALDEPTGFRFGLLRIRSRTDWGCPDRQGAPLWPPAYTTVTHAVVHHTAGANNLPDWDAEMRNIWYFHSFSRGWGDIGYNYLIDPNGVVYEGRAGGERAIAAHFSCRNTNTVGVAMLGTFIDGIPTEAARESLRKLLAELIWRNQIEPAVMAYHPPTALLLPTVLGHRDGNLSPNVCSTTVCPGNALYALLPALRSELEACDHVQIGVHPSSTTIPPGGSTTLSVKAHGSSPFMYQWYLGSSGDTSTPLEGGTEPALSVSPSVPTSYWVRISNFCGEVDSGTVVVAVGPTGRRRAIRPQ